MTRRIIAAAYGGPEVLTLVDEPLTEPGPADVTVRIRAAAVNPWDHKSYSGQMGDDPSSLPIELGSEAAGEVIAAGPGATGPDGPVRVGDEVIVSASGLYAEEVVVPASKVLRKPQNLSWEEASGLLTVGTTAEHGLSVAALGDGDTLLVHGAAGSVGLAAIQFAVARGVRVIGTASEKNHALLSELGAEPVAYGEGLAERVRALAPDDVDAAFDTVGTDEAIDVSLALLADPARVISIGAFGRREDGITLLGFGPGADPGTKLRADAKPVLVERAAKGAFRSLVSRTYPLAEAAEAHLASIRGHSPGKLVLLP